MFKMLIGLRGTGKSYSATYEALVHIKRGLDVFSTFPIIGANKLLYNDLLKYSFPAGSLLIIDESGIKMNCRSFMKLDMSILEFFSQSRKSDGIIGGYDLIVISQSTNIDKQITALVDMFYVFDNPYLLDILGWVRFGGYIYYNFEDINKRDVDRNRFFYLKKNKVFNSYDTNYLEELRQRIMIPKVRWTYKDERIENEQSCVE